MSSHIPKDIASRRKKLIKSDYLTCRPLTTYNDIQMFLENPPAWRTLCKELTPHSEAVIRNIERHRFMEPSIEAPENYCHFDPDADTATRYPTTNQKLPKTLVCHDMANGYHEDSLIDGSTNHEAYTFYNWAGIDIFCYFSHHLITIPPLGWINVGHAHGVKVIGTVITEWAEGVIFWEEILTSESTYQKFACEIVAIAKTLKFDGWLLNIENKILRPKVLLEFVKYLHETLHKELKDPVLIWYDSVVDTGNLNWQNCLNEKNKAFFNACDGFFTNYSWSVADVESSAKEAGDRITDLYIGIDIWGRNFYGGGQFNTQQAVKVAYDAGCSLAIFAPAWTLEAMAEDAKPTSTIAMGASLDKLAKFMLRDRALWCSLWPYLYTHVPCVLPFQTSFCRGLGKKRWSYGEVISPGPWYNLRHQQYQPNAAHGPHGYFLSPIEKIQQVSDAAFSRDKRGIIRYRSTFKASRVNLISTRPEDHKDELIDDQIVENKTDSFHSFKSVKSVESIPGTVPSERDRTIQEHVDSASDVDKKVVRDESSKCVILKRKLSESLKRLCRKLSWHKESKTVVLPESTKRDEASTSREVPVAESMSDTLELKGREHESEYRDVKFKDIQSVCNLDAKPRVNAENESEHELDETTPISLNLQKRLKTRWALACVPRERECLEVYLDDGFNGGSCLRVNPSDGICTEHRVTRLLHCDFLCEGTLIFCVVTKTLPQYADQALNLRLSMTNAQGEDLRVLLMSRPLGLDKSLDESSSGINYLHPLYSEKQEAFQKLRKYLLLHQPGFYIPIENFYGWEVKYFEVHVPGARMRSVNCRTEGPQGGLLLGHLGICQRKESD